MWNTLDQVRSALERGQVLNKWMWQKSGTACNEGSCVPNGNLRKSEIFRPTATSKRFVAGLPERNASRFPCRWTKGPFPMSGESLGLAPCFYLHCFCAALYRPRVHRFVQFRSWSPPLPIGRYQFYLGWPLDTDQTQLSSERCILPFQRSIYIYTHRRWRLISFMQH